MKRLISISLQTPVCFALISSNLDLLNTRICQSLANSRQWLSPIYKNGSSSLKPSPLFMHNHEASDSFELLLYKLTFTAAVEFTITNQQDIVKSQIHMGSRVLTHFTTSQQHRDNFTRKNGDPFAQDHYRKFVESGVKTHQHQYAVLLTGKKGST